MYLNLKYSGYFNFIILPMHKIKPSILAFSNICWNDHPKIKFHQLFEYLQAITEN